MLDQTNTAPINRVVEAIDWAIEKQVHIINISFTTSTNSPELESAVKRAYDAGILLVAAAGNNGYVEYPAAYPEVIAVGSVNSQGQVSSFSTPGTQVELVAPGELITSTDVFDTLATHSGTSFAAPHVTAIASKLWEKDLTCSNKFIRCVLDISANMYGEIENCGYGLVDYDFACKVYEYLKPIAKDSKSFEAIMQYAIEICDIYNPSDIPVSDANIDIVEGAWYLDKNNYYAHRTIFDGYNVKNTNGRALIMAGCNIADNGSSTLDGMTLNPYFHGYLFYKNGSIQEESNYIAGGIYLTRIAQAMMSGTVYNSYSSHIETSNYTLRNTIDNTYINKNTGRKWSDVKNAIDGYPYDKQTGSTDINASFDPNNRIHRALVVYGMGLHSFADIFSHSSVSAVDSKLVLHTTTSYDNIGYKNAADNVDFIPQRYAAASHVCRNALELISSMPAGSNQSNTDYSNYKACDISIFDLSGTNYADYFKIANFKKYANNVCNVSSLFKDTNTYSPYFDLLDAGTFYDPHKGMYYNPETGTYQ